MADFSIDVLADFDIEVRKPGLHPVVVVDQSADRILIFTKVQAQTLIEDLELAIEALPEE